MFLFQVPEIRGDRDPQTTHPPFFKADAAGPYWIYVKGIATYVDSITGKTSEKTFYAEMIIHARETLTDLTVKAVELTQAIQTAKGVETDMESGEVPLVAFKDTIVRVYAGISGPSVRGSTLLTIPSMPQACRAAPRLFCGCS